MLFFVLPHLHEILHAALQRGWRDLLADLDDAENVTKVFEGLIVIAVALIVFVAESIRDSNNAEKKQVLLRISRLWPLTLAVTLFPLGYLIGKLTGLSVILILSMSLLAIYQFAKVIRNLLDVDLQEANRRSLLKERARLACTRFRRHRVRCFDGTGGVSWSDGSLRESSSLRLCG